MAKVRDSYLALLDKWLYHGYTLQSSRMTDDQKLRTEIVYEVYQIWLQHKQIDPMDITRQVADRKYRQMIEAAKIDPEMKERCEKLGIRYVSEGTTEIVRRGPTAIYNDVVALNHIIGTYTAPVTNIEKAKVVHASDWLIKHGMESGDGRDVYKGADLKMRLNKEFDEREQGYEDMANADFGITSDVSVVKPGQRNYTDEEKKAFAKRFGLTTKEVVDLVEMKDGTFGIAEDDTGVEEGQDFFDENDNLQAP